MSAIGTLDLILHPDALLALAEHTAALREHAAALSLFAAAIEGRPEPPATSSPELVRAIDPPAAAAPATAAVHWATEARKQALREMVPAGEDWRGIEARLAQIEGPQLPGQNKIKGYAFGVLNLRRDPAKLRPIDRERLARMGAAKAAPAPAPVARPTRALPKPAPQPISRAEEIARVGAIKAPTRGFEPIEADFDQVRTWAGQRWILFEGWDDLPAVNAKRERLQLPTFKRKFR